MLNSLSSYQLINQLSDIVVPINHIIFEFVILILVYIAITKTQNIQLKTRYRWSFLFLFAIFAIGIDWFMWLDIKKTLLFGLLILIYIYYNIYNESTHSQFLDIVYTANDNTNQVSMANKNNIIINANNQARIDKQIANLTYTPPDLSPKYLERTEYVDGNPHLVNPTNGTSEAIALQNHIQQDYTNTALTALYNSSQYHNILKTDIDQYLDNNIHNNVVNNVMQTHQHWENYALLKNPKKVFFDSNWMHIKTPWYNDHCYSNGEENDFVKFGYKLENCTNQTNAPLDPSMTLISSNDVQPILRNFTGGFISG
uniref:Uncharacterized protein n=1 Tax=viral metagenome TaxID=1070528 RepID=A0A6C0HMS3_9ZZZZ